MNVERGFYRLTMVLAVTILSVGLAFVLVFAYVEHDSRQRTLNRIAKMKALELMAECDRAKGRAPVADGPLSLSAERAPMTGKYTYEVRTPQGAAAEITSDQPVTSLQQMWELIFAQQPGVREENERCVRDYEASGVTPGGMLLWGTLITAVLAAVPFGVFRVVRWIARGFGNATPLLPPE
jgi:hypothetical protein